MRTKILFLGLLLHVAVFAQKGNEVNHFDFDTLQWEKMTDKVYRKYAYGSGGMIAYLKLFKGAFIPKHNHPNEQITHILEGKVEVIIGEQKYIVSAGEVLIIPPNVPHSFLALETTLDLDVFTPIRQDWIDNKANYFAGSNVKKELIEVAKLKQRPGNVTVGGMSDVYATLHPLDQPKMQLVKFNQDGSYSAFPNESWQKSENKMVTDFVFDTPLGVQVDQKNRLWTIDMGLTIGKTRLFAFDLATGKNVFNFTLPNAIAPKGSFIQDLAIDEINGFVYLADIENPGIIIVDIKKKIARRISHPTFNADGSKMIIDNQLINFNGKPANVAINPLTLSKDKSTLYYGAMNGTTWYAMDTKEMRSNASDEIIFKSIKKVGNKPVSDGAVSDDKGNHYFTNLNENGVDFWNAEMKTLEPFLRDEQLKWPDNLAIGKDGFLYISVNQLHLTPAFTGTEDKGSGDYYIYKVKLN